MRHVLLKFALVLFMAVLLFVDVVNADDRKRRRKKKPKKESKWVCRFGAVFA